MKRLAKVLIIGLLAIGISGIFSNAMATPLTFTFSSYDNGDSTLLTLSGSQEWMSAWNQYSIKTEDIDPWSQWLSGAGFYEEWTASELEELTVTHTYIEDSIPDEGLTIEEWYELWTVDVGDTENWTFNNNEVQHVDTHSIDWLMLDDDGAYNLQQLSVHLSDDTAFSADYASEVAVGIISVVALSGSTVLEDFAFSNFVEGATADVTGYWFGNPDNPDGELAYVPFQIVVTNTLETGPTVPEPTTMLLFGFGLLGLAGVNRTRKQ
jgi:hypothetical protein